MSGGLEVEKGNILDLNQSPPCGVISLAGHGVLEGSGGYVGSHTIVVHGPSPHH